MEKEITIPILGAICAAALMRFVSGWCYGRGVRTPWGLITLLSFLLAVVLYWLRPYYDRQAASPTAHVGNCAAAAPSIKGKTDTRHIPCNTAGPHELTVHVSVQIGTAQSIRDHDRSMKAPEKTQQQVSHETKSMELRPRSVADRREADEATATPVASGSSAPPVTRKKDPRYHGWEGYYGHEWTEPDYRPGGRSSNNREPPK